MVTSFCSSKVARKKAVDEPIVETNSIADEGLQDGGLGVEN